MAYFYPYKKLLDFLVRKINLSLVITNSEYTKGVIKSKINNVDPIVLHPPVDIDLFLKASEARERRDNVVLCGRYSPEKNYEFALEIAERLPDVSFTVIGSVYDANSARYYEKLNNMVKTKMLNNVKLLRNVPRDVQLGIYSTSKVFLHAMKGEHFGIAVVEGMAAGLVPVVHRSGGAWLDILDRGRYGLGYETLEEAAKNIERALSNYQEIREKAIKRAMRFDRKVFVRKFSMIVREFDKFLA